MLRLVSIAYVSGEPLARPANPLDPPRLHGTLERESVPLRYRAGILLATLGMLLLPALYIFMVVGILYLTVYHLAYHLHWLFGPQARWWSAAAYLCLGGIGAVQGLFLLKPLWAVTRRDPRDRSVSPEEEPDLFAFVRSLCSVIGAPVPCRLYVNSDVNAYARYSPGIVNLFRGRVELVFGMSLVAGLTLQQFAAMVAHELAHFGQGWAIRLIYIVRGVERWFEQAVNDRDVWDDWLVRGSRRLELGVGFFFHIARGCLWLTRQALRPFMFLGRFLSCYLLRQMELDADRYAVKLAGVEAFESLLVQTRILEAAQGLARKTLSLSWQEGRLGDDFPALVKAHTRIFIAEVRSKIEKEMRAEKSGILSTHPSFAERIAEARKIAGTGLGHLHAQAPTLFLDFHSLCREVTLRLYANDLQEEFFSERLTTTGDIMSGQSLMQAGEAALESYFFGLQTWLRPLRPGKSIVAPLAASELPAARAALMGVRARIEAELPAARRHFLDFLQADMRLIQAIQAGALLAARFQIDPDDFHLEAGTPSVSAQTVMETLRDQESLSEKLAPLDQAFCERLLTALSALPVLVETQALRDGEQFLSDAATLLPALSGLLPALEAAMHLRKDFSEMFILVENLRGNEKGRELGEAIHENSLRLHQALVRLRALLEKVAHPFPISMHAYADLSGYVLDALPEADDFERVFSASEKALSRLDALYQRIMGQLALIAGSVEGALGLGPLHLPGDSYSLPELSAMG